jgi:Flp pilus assembly protein TadG
LRLQAWIFPKRRGRRDRGERGSELIDFAIVVVLLIALLYGVLTYGLILAAQSTINQAAADAARSGIITTTPVVTAEAQAGSEVSWMDKGICGTSRTTITCNAEKIRCPSNLKHQCLKVTVSYNYSSNPLFLELPGVSLITPSTISSTNVVQIPSSA